MTRRRRTVLVVAVVVAVVVTAACSSGSGAGGGHDAAAEPRPRLAPADAPRLPVERQELAGALWQGEIAVLGGLTEDGVASNRLDLYDPARRRWRQGPDLPVRVHHTAAVVLGDRLWLIGGRAHEGDRSRVSAAVWSLGPQEARWREEAALATAREAPGAAVIDGGRIMVVGGRDADAKVLASTEVYDPTVGAWQPGPPLTIARDHVAVVVVDRTVYALSGTRGSQGDTMAHEEQLTLPDGRWREVPPGLEIDRGGAVAFVLDGRPCVVGGEPELQYDRFVECFRDGRWTYVTKLGNKRHGGVGVLVGRDLHLIGGGTQSGRYVINDHEVVQL